jgi:hypothetical protein
MCVLDGILDSRLLPDVRVVSAQKLDEVWYCSSVDHDLGVLRSSRGDV